MYDILFISFSCKIIYDQQGQNAGKREIQTFRYLKNGNRFFGRIKRFLIIFSCFLLVKCLWSRTDGKPQCFGKRITVLRRIYISIIYVSIFVELVFLQCNVFFFTKYLLLINSISFLPYPISKRTLDILSSINSSKIYKKFDKRVQPCKSRKHC